MSKQEGVRPIDGNILPENGENIHGGSTDNLNIFGTIITRSKSVV
jgi:hypothetical protein